MKSTMPSHGAATKLAGTKPSGASFDKPTIRPAFSTPHKLSPTIKPDATSVPSRSARSGFGELNPVFCYVVVRVATLRKESINDTTQVLHNRNFTTRTRKLFGSSAV